MATSFAHVESEAHPRSRGENRAHRRGRRSWGGSSPLTRGKQTAADQPPANSRLIPAHAGKTTDLDDLTSVYRAHPRSRGENSEIESMRAQNTGSSPLTRGKLARALHLEANRGLIPAHAGKTRLRLRRPIGSQAHPRSRGENVGGDPQELPDLGSSPLTRGKPFRGCRCSRARGLIPAHAGKTHAGGAGDEGGRGSSPLTRGKHADDGAPADSHGLIPAHAGKTRS